MFFFIRDAMIMLFLNSNRNPKTLPSPELEAKTPRDASSSNRASLHSGHIPLTFVLLNQLDLDP